MAIALDQLLGSAGNDAASTTIAFNTSATVASSGFIVVGVAWTGGVLNSVAGGSLTWAIDKQGAGGAANAAVCSAQAPSGLASGTTITATFSVSANARVIGGISFTGVASSAALDGTPPATHTDGSGTAWASNSQTIAAGSVAVGVNSNLVGGVSSTATSPSLEIYDVDNGAGNSGGTAAYRIEAAGGSVTVAGTWSASASGATTLAAYLAGAGAPTLINEPRHDFEPVRFGPF